MPRVGQRPTGRVVRACVPRLRRLWSSRPITPQRRTTGCVPSCSWCACWHNSPRAHGGMACLEWAGVSGCFTSERDHLPGQSHRNTWGGLAVQGQGGVERPQGPRCAPLAGRVLAEFL
eukprot:6758611-Alexandrium_andersonii.AAC.1